MLRSQIGVAKLALAHGNMPRAESMLDETIERAGEHGFTELRAIALHDRSTVAHARGDYERAIRFAYEALDGISVPSARDRVLADIAGCFLTLGVRSAARDAYMVLAATAQEQYSRWSSTLNLMEIAALDQCEPAFEQYRRDLDDADLPPRLEALYHLEAGKAYDIFGNAEAARESVERAIETAERNQFHQIAFQAAECLKQLLRGKRHVPQPAAFENAELEPVAVALKEMRVAAGVG